MLTLEKDFAAEVPALLITISIPPKRSAAISTARIASVSIDTSAEIEITSFPVFSRISSTALFKASSFRATIAT
ncbi:hypothetical protein D3C81_1852890 [compost metagenome]